MRVNPEKFIYILVPLYLLLLIFGRNINEVLYSILSFVWDLACFTWLINFKKNNKIEKRNKSNIILERFF